MKTLIKTEEQKTGVQINHQTRVQVEKLAQILPSLKSQWQLKISLIVFIRQWIMRIQMISKEEQGLKIYPFAVFVKNQSKQMEFYNVWTIMKQATKGDFQKAIHLSGCELGQEHILLRTPKYPLSFREYLWRHRDANQLKTLVIDLALGLKELHTLGYVHRELKPENIMVSLKPLKATLIVFNRSYPLTQSTQGTCRGTEGYFPQKEDLRDGSTKWDIWSLGAMILEADLGLNEYLMVHSEKGAVFKAGQNLRDEKPSKELAAIINGTILTGNNKNIMTIDQILDQLSRYKLRKHV